MGVSVPKAFARTREESIGVAVLGATGSVGQRFVQLLAHHPWFELRALCASEGRVGQKYGATVAWVQETPIPGASAELALRGFADLDPTHTPVVFSALPGDLAGPIESELASRGFWVVSNASSHRMDADVPLLVPEVNAEHLGLLDRQPGPGALLAGPNCSSAGLVLALAPLQRRFGLQAALVVTLQAHSGAGLPGVLGPKALQNVLPNISGEVDKLESEPKKILGTLQGGAIRALDLALSASCNRVHVVDGHTECVSVKLARPASRDDVLAAWNEFAALDLPSAPVSPVLVLDTPDAPNPLEHRNLQHGMATVVGQLRPCSVLDWKFTLLSHNTLRGAAGGAILIAESAVKAFGML